MAMIKILLIFAILLFCMNLVLSKPYETNLFRKTENLSRCEKTTEIDITCQKCAKITKSNVVYPMCCTDKEDAYRWCYKYINFGLQKRNSQLDFKEIKNSWLSRHHMMQYVEEGPSDITKTMSHKKSVGKNVLHSPNSLENY